MKTQNTSYVAEFQFFLLLCGVIVFWGIHASGEEWTDE
jgi:hypothetical protein